MLSESEFFAVVITKIFYMIGRDLLVLEFDGFRLLQQLFIPALTGGIGGLSLMLMASLSNYGEFSLKVFYRTYIKLAILGGIAGIAAVNLLNPGGDISQVMVLGLIAGLSGFSYLKRNSLVDNIHEDALLEGIRASVIKEAEQFLGRNKIKKEIEDEVGNIIDPDEFEDEKELDSQDIDGDKVKKYIDKKVNEWIEEHPYAIIEEIEEYYEEVVGEVLTNPEVINFEE